MAPLLHIPVQRICCILLWARKERSLTFEIHLYTYACQHGLEVCFGSSFVSLFAESGSVSHAHQVFLRIPQIPGEISWSSLIAGHVANGGFDRALPLYAAMQDAFDAPHLHGRAFVALLKACAASNDLDRGRMLHARIDADTSLKADDFVTSALINMYVNCGSITQAEEVFNNAQVRNVVSWNALMTGYVEYGQAEVVLTLFEQMEIEGISSDSVTLSCTLKACGIIGAKANGHCVHAEITRKGLGGQLLLGNTLIDMYAKCGALQAAHRIFDMLPVRTNVSWNALISGFVENGHPETALSYFKDMKADFVTPDAFTLTSALKACNCGGSILEGYQLHTEISLRGLAEADAFIGSALIYMYASCLSLIEVHEVFNKICRKTLVSWNALLTGYMDCGDGGRVLDCFHQMQCEGISPDAITLVCVLKACAVSRATPEGHAVHRKIILEGFPDSNNLIGSSLVDMYANCEKLEEAQHVFDELRIKPTVCWNVLIGGYVEQGHYVEALHYFEQMQKEGNSRDSGTLVWGLKACASLSDAFRGQELHAEMYRKCLENDASLRNCVIDMYAKCSLLEEAEAVADMLPAPSVIAQTALMSGYMEQGHPEKALQCFEEMKLHGISPDASALICGLRACSRLGAVKKGHEMHVFIIKASFLEGDMTLGNTLIVMYVKFGILAEAQDVLDKLPTRSIVSWTALITGYVDRGFGEYALSCYERMQSEGIPTDAVTYLCCLTACSNIPDIVRGQELHRSISKKGLETGPMIGNSLVDMYAKCGLLASALALFEKLEIPDIVSWNSLIAGFSQHGECEDVFELLREMIGKNIDPDPVTFGSILSACSHAGLVDKGQMYFKIMSSYYGFIPMMEHFNCLSDIFGRAGQVEKAIAIIEHLPCHPSTALWHSVLASCRKTGHVELGEQAFECAIQLDDKDSSTYICMLNIYADEAHILDATSRR